MDGPGGPGGPGGYASDNAVVMVARFTTVKVSVMMVDTARVPAAIRQASPSNGLITILVSDIGSMWWLCLSHE
ncbi:MAG: hypothetical protein CML73_00450 [Rhodobiaceae bacterium]|nr:hypothetical protein [Rhodobiaceae bacterium]